MTTDTNNNSPFSRLFSSDRDPVINRADLDRRKHKLYTIWVSLTAPRRFVGRRSSDRRTVIMDRYDSGLFTMAVLLVLMSVTDSVFTLTLIGRGATEANPFMNYMLQHSVGLFMTVKMLLTGVPALLLVASHNLVIFNRVKARSFLGAAVGMYAGLILYEIGLLIISSPV